MHRITVLGFTASTDKNFCPLKHGKGKQARLPNQ